MPKKSRVGSGVGVGTLCSYVKACIFLSFGLTFLFFPHQNLVSKSIALLHVNFHRVGYLAFLYSCILAHCVGLMART